MIMIRLIFILGIALVAVTQGGCLNNLHASEYKCAYDHAEVFTPDGTLIRVEVADTVEKRRLGLGKRSHLRAGWGMLFIFDVRKRHSFWMKDMHFSIDIIWLDNYRIVHIEHAVPPPLLGTSPPLYTPRNPANFVLEIAAGQAKALKLDVGDSLKYQFD